MIANWLKWNKMAATSLIAPEVSNNTVSLTEAKFIIRYKRLIISDEILFMLLLSG